MPRAAWGTAVVPGGDGCFCTRQHGRRPGWGCMGISGVPQGPGNLKAAVCNPAPPAVVPGIVPILRLKLIRGSCIITAF